MINGASAFINLLRSGYSSDVLSGGTLAPPNTRGNKMDIVARLKASSCNETCLLATAAKEITRLRKIEAAARCAIKAPWVGEDFDGEMEALADALEGEE